jgi:hypothetical protein
MKRRCVERRNRISASAAQWMNSREMLRAFGNMQLESAPGTISPASGYIATMLTRTLTGSYGGTTFNTYTVDGISAWYSWVQENAYTSCSS